MNGEKREELEAEEEKRGASGSLLLRQVVWD